MTLLLSIVNLTAWAEDGQTGVNMTKAINGTVVTFTSSTVTSSNEETVEVDFSAQGWTNAEAPTAISLSNGTTIDFGNLGGNNAPKYYDATKGVRLYAKNTIIIKASKPVAKIVLNCDSYNGTDYTGNDMAYASVEGNDITICNDNTEITGGTQIRVQTMSITFDGEETGSGTVTSTVATPTFSRQNNMVTISTTTENATIYYTLDGSTPTRQSAQYSAPFEVTQNGTIKAFAVKDGLDDSAVATYEVNWIGAAETETYTLPQDGSFVPTDNQEIQATASVKLMFGADGNWQISGSYVYGDNNANYNGANIQLGSYQLPNQGTYYKFTPSRSGTLKLQLGIYPPRPIVVMTGPEGAPFFNYEIRSESGSVIALDASCCIDLNDEHTAPSSCIFNVEAGKEYYFMQSAARPGFSGFTFTSTTSTISEESTYAYLHRFDNETTGNKVIYQFANDARNQSVLANGVWVAINGDESKTVNQGKNITVNGTQYLTMKVSNGKQNTLHLSHLAKAITFYSYINQQSGEVDGREVYWKEVAGVQYESAEASGGAMQTYVDQLDSQSNAYDTRTYSLSKADSVITFTNTGYQVCYIVEVEYAPENHVETPTFTKNGNVLTISTTTENATIYYTLDGSTPTRQSTQYTAPFEVTHNCTVKAIAVAEGYDDSEVATYTVNWLDGGITIYVKCDTAPYIWWWGLPDGQNSQDLEDWPGTNQLKDTYTHPDTGEKFWTWTFAAGSTPVSFLFNNGDATAIKQTGDINRITSDRYFLLSWDDGNGNVSLEDVSEDYGVVLPNDEVNTVTLSGNHNAWGGESSDKDVFNILESGKTFQIKVDLTGVTVEDNIWQFKFRPNNDLWIGYWDLYYDETPEEGKAPKTDAPAWLGASLDGNFSIDLDAVPERVFTFTITWNGGTDAGKNWSLRAEKSNAVPLEPYARFENDELVFMYDRNKTDNDFAVTTFNSPEDRAWHQSASSIKGVRIAESFSDYMPTSTAFWFYGMEMLEALDLSSLTMTNVTNTSGMFTNCSLLATITVNNTWPAQNGAEGTVTPGGSGSSVTGSDMFNGCRSLKGGAGTTYDASHVDYTYAHIDGGESNPGYFTDKSAVKEIIEFADANVKALCIRNWDADGDGELSKTEAAAVTTLGDIFKGNTTITTFDELQYFTGLTAIENYAFQGCTSLTSVTLPPTVTSIGSASFRYCAFSSFEIPSTVTSIGFMSFADCTGLSSISIPSTLTTIGASPFFNCNLDFITVEEENSTYDSRGGCNAIINKNSNSLLQASNNTVIPNDVVTIGARAFSGCNSITNIAIPSSVKSIGIYAFTDCSALTEMTIPGTVTSIGDCILSNCANLTRVSVENSNSVYDSREDCNGIIETATNTMIFGYAKTSIPNGVTTIGYYAFSYSPGLTSISFPNSVTKIGDSAFQGCEDLESITLPSQITSIGEGAFSGIENTKLTEIVLPGTLTEIGSRAFGWCHFSSVVSEIENPFVIPNDVFYSGLYNVYASAVLHVPAGTYETYRNTKGWNKFVNIEGPNGEGAKLTAPEFAWTDGKLSMTSKEGADIYYSVSRYSAEPTGDGSEANPFNVAAAIAKCKETGETATAEKYYIKGIVVSGAKADAPYGNITFRMGDSNAEGANTFYSYRVYGPDSTKLAEDYEVKVGEEVVVYGSLINYRSSTPETVQGAYLISKTTPELTSRYGGPIQVSGNTFVRAKATKDGMSDSDIAMMSTSAAANPEPYVVLSENNTVMTFCYDDQKTAKGGMDVGPFVYDSRDKRGWSPYTSQITKAVFDQSFDQCTTLTSTAFWFTYMTQLETIEHIEYLHTDNVEDMNCMFDSCYVLRDLDVSHFVTAKVKNMNCMFNRCEALTSLNLRNFDTSNCTILRGMFYDCKGLTSLDITNFNTSKNTSTESMFELCSSLESITFGSGFSTENVTSMGWMFAGCSALKNIDVGRFNTNNVTNMQAMFHGCENLSELNVSSFNTEKVMDMSWMFVKCSSLTALNVSGFNTANVTTMYAMFFGCEKLSTLDVSSFNTTNVTDMAFMFGDCMSLTNINWGSYFNTEKVTSMRAMFQLCSSLTSLDLSNFNTQNVTDMSYMFSTCSGLTNPNMKSFNTSNVTEMYAMFASCSALTTLDMSSFSTANVTDMGDMFYENSSLASIQAGNAVIPDSIYAQIGNPNLLLYVNEASQAPASVKNVVVLDEAEQIVLTDTEQGNNNFYCPRQFTAKSISYTHNYKQTTQVGVSRGWETIALPFAVQSITHERNGALAPFGAEGGKPFWLAQLTENGLVSAQRIEAYVPYLISMPNNSIYPGDYNQAGNVTFSATNAVVYVTEQKGTSGNNRMLIPAYQRVEQSPSVYAINRNASYESNPEGSIFVANYREVRPFEAYVEHPNGGARYYTLGDLSEGDVTGLQAIRNIVATDLVKVYNLSGVLVKSGKRHEVIPHLTKGVYIINGSKVVVK